MNIGKPAILVPSPHVAGDHQTKNAASLARTGAAILLKEEMLETSFIRSITGLIRDAAKLKRMSEEMKRHAKPEAEIGRASCRERGKRRVREDAERHRGV